MRTRMMVIVIAATFTPTSWIPAGERSSTEEHFKNRPGWSWVVEPFRWEGKTQTNGGNGVVMLVEEGKQQELIVVFAMPFRGVEGFHGSWEPVAFDEQGTRQKLRARVAEGWATEEGGDGTFLYRWGSTPATLPASQVVHIGLEGLTTEGWKLKLKKDATKARIEAEQRGLDVLLFPVVGQSYSFELKDLDGNIIKSKQLKGKVVVLDFWATWCSPCMQKMPELKMLYKQWHDDGLEVVGINFDHNEKTCQEAIERLGLRWRNSIAPMNEDLRKIWMDAIGVKSLPRILIIDREGRLRVDCDPGELEEHVTKLMKATPNADN